MDVSTCAPKHISMTQAASYMHHQAKARRLVLRAPTIKNNTGCNDMITVKKILTLSRFFVKFIFGRGKHRGS